MKLFLQILLILTIILTISICVIQPDLHKNVIVYDSAYTLVSEEEVKTETKQVPVMEMPIKPIEKTIIAERKTEPTVTTKKIQANNTKKQSVKTTSQKNVKQAATPATKTVTKPNTVKIQKSAETVKTVEPKQTHTQQIKEEKSIPAVKTLTQQEETIAWNKWRSTLTNQIMQDTRLPNIPNGTVFQFSFTVDKYGKITNVQTGANPANYTPYAIQYIAPVIRSYQGKSILNFPEGTARTLTQVTGKWRISSTERYSTPQDYNDLEKVLK